MEKVKGFKKFNVVMLLLLSLGVFSPSLGVVAETTEQTVASSVQESESTLDSTATTTSENKEVVSEENTTPIAAKKETKAASKGIVRIMHTNDMHGRMEYLEDKYSPSIGLGRVKTFKDNQKPTLLVDAGDAMQGLPISNYSKGVDMAKAMNAVGYDAMTLGNHEFDFGLEQALMYKDILKFPIVSANVYKDGVRPFDPYTIVEKEVEGEKKRFALIGLTTPETTVKTHPNNIVGVTFKKPAPVAIETINYIEEKDGGADYFVFMTHLGIDETTVEDERSTYLASQLATNFPDKKIFIADGHSHTALPEGIKSGHVLIGQTGNHLNNVGMMTGDYTAEEPKLSAKLHPFSELQGLTPDPAVEAIVAEAKAKFDQEMSGVLMENNKILFNGERENVRSRETNLGNLVGDALLAYGKTSFKEPSDFAIMNGGGLRQSIKPGKVTKGDVVGVMPFGNIVSQVKVSGNEIYAMFEHSLRSMHVTNDAGEVILDENGFPKLGANGGFLQVSDSIEVLYDSNLQGADSATGLAGQRVHSIKIKDASGNFVIVPRTDDLVYNMVTNDFLAAGGDGYSMLVGKPVDEGPSMDEVFMNYITSLDDKKLASYEKELPMTRIISAKEEALPAEDREQQALAKAIASLKELDKEEFTAFSWAKLSKEIEKAEAALALKDETKAKTAKDSLQQVTNELVDISELRELVKKGDTLKAADYKVMEWKEFELALKEAKDLLEKAKDETIEVTTEEVIKVSEKLNKAMKSLVPVKKDTGKDGSNLPKTGEEKSSIAYIGLGLVGVTGIYIYSRNKKNKAA
ncbi:5'-nucleotidase C-terminal domain-containing protein [Vagococcus fluvialis]|uniref:5'-nucleotidase C-terminal domain-containing protein n=1 Tax=Vagococcus fluvialis TaxID=2738 RepID=UPI00288FA825|nr:5'-nucleotidase C-terminal domain-containing protein [Vagococcus fluvialis]MDT2781456.1 5'-nucleotidase C-terminal domain-containing protein [Vagococcus fluvialis]